MPICYLKKHFLKVLCFIQSFDVMSITVLEDFYFAFFVSIPTLSYISFTEKQEEQP